MKEQIIELRKQGKTYREIQKELDCSLGTIAFHCGDGQKLKYKEANDRRRIRNRKWMEDIKKELRCEKCKEDRWWVLDFHHTNPSEKEGGIARFLKSKGRVKILEEIKKCKILCSNCHRDLHYRHMVQLVDTQDLKS